MARMRTENRRGSQSLPGTQCPRPNLVRNARSLRILLHVDVPDNFLLAPSSSSSSMQPPYRQYQDVEHQYRPLPPPSELPHYSPDPYAPYYLPPEQPPHRYDEPRYEERRYEERSRPMDPSRHESYTPVPSSSQSVYPSRSRPDEEMEPPPQKRPRSTEPRKAQTRKTEIACDFCRGELSRLAFAKMRLSFGA